MEYTLIDKPGFRFFTIHNDSRVIALNSSEHKALFYDALHLHKENYRQLVQVPKQTYGIQYNPKSLLCITESNDLYYDILFLVRFMLECLCNWFSFSPTFRKILCLFVLLG